uniref:Berberine bridge enzyme-like 21 n=1 Tax=Tanacetum cinerariifolium TaxID=118510 RepID=A0A699I2Y2_TANCI|nr:berberine bridge enzyme-like 21 [Tanacetum cinerariifolium]
MFSMSSNVFLLAMLLISFGFFISSGAGPAPKGPPFAPKAPPKGPGPAPPKRPVKGPGTTPPKGPVPSDPNSIYKSFVECLPTLSPQPDPTFASIVHSSTANSSTYTKTLVDKIKNRRYNTTSTPKPAIIVTPTKEAHVQATVLCAKKLGIQIKIRSGGHDYEAVSYVSSEKNFILLDMFNFKTVDVNIATETAVVQVGAQLGDLYYRISEKSQIHGFPAGACPTVGAGGHISGAGYGTMIRKYGVTVDHVIDAKIVDVNGKLLDRKAMGEDLFWAIRGAGGSSFCVIISFTIKLVPVPKVNTVFRVERTIEQNATDILVKWQAVMPTIDHDLWIRILVQPVTLNNKNTIRVTFMSLFLGDSARLLGLMSKQFPELGLKKEDCFDVSYIQAKLYWANFDYNKTKPELLMDRHSDTVKFIKRKSDYVQTAIPKAGLTAIFNKLLALGKVGLVFNPYGGKMNEVPANAVPFPHRAGNLFKVQYSMNWEETDPKTTETILNQGKAMYEFMTPYVSKNPRGAFINYRDFDIGVNSGDGFASGKVYGEKYFKGNFERLVKIKTAVDPDNFFRNEQSIPTLPKRNKG